MTEKDESLRISRIAALLEFYSGRAVAHASFFVASVFGLVTLLAIIQQMQGSYLDAGDVENPALVLLSMLLLLGFSYMGHFTLIRFNYYADFSDKLSQGLHKEEILKGIDAYDVVHGKTEKTTLLSFLEKATVEQERLLIGKRILAAAHGGGRRLLMASAYWIVMLSLGWMVYSGIWLYWLLAWLFFFVLAVILPILYHKVRVNRSIRPGPTRCLVEEL